MTTQLNWSARQRRAVLDAPPAVPVPAAPPHTGLRVTGSPPSDWTVGAANPVSYRVRLVKDLLDPDNPALIEAGATRREVRPRRFLVVDEVVHGWYGDRLRGYLDANQVEYAMCVLPASEQHKTMDCVLTVVRGLDKFGIDRRHEPVIGVGGGVVLDVVGLASSLYRRSTPYVRVPTTLIGLVDAGVGAKTGVNLDTHKNRLGTYFPATTALLDPAFLGTLDERHLSNGMAEILKIGLVKDQCLFELLAAHGERLIAERFQRPTEPAGQVASEVLGRAIHGMLEELQPNLWEHELQRVVDYGHTFSPTIEMAALPSLLHGEAVAIDMALTTVLATHRGLVTPEQRDRVFQVMRRLRLPIWHPLCTPRNLIDALAETVAHRDGSQRLPLPVGIGGVRFVNDVQPAELVGAAGALRALSGGGNG